MYVSPDSLIRDARSVRSNVFDGSETEINLCVTFSLQRHKRMDALWLVVRFEIFFLRAGLEHGNGYDYRISFTLLTAKENG